MTNNKKDNRKISQILSVIVDLIIIPLIIVAMISSITMINAKRHNKVPSFMGYSVVTIMSPSMDTEEYGQNFKVDEVVVLKNCGVKDVKVGDVVAFYKPNDVVVIFHRVVAITNLNNSDNYSDGTYIATQGDANGDIYDEVKNLNSNQKINISFSDNHYVLNKTDGDNIIQTYDCNAQQIEVFRSDFLVGKYVQNAGALSKVINFCSSTVGIILLVCIPSAILFIVLLIQISKENKRNKEEKDTENLQHQQLKDTLNNTESPKTKKVDNNQIEEKLKTATASSFPATQDNLKDAKKDTKDKVKASIDTKQKVTIKEQEQKEQSNNVKEESLTKHKQTTKSVAPKVVPQIVTAKQPTSTPKKVPIVKPQKVSEDSNSTKPKAVKPTIKNKPE